MKAILNYSIAFAMLFAASCKKDQPFAAPGETHTYLSVKDFYAQNGVPMQTCTVDASVGGSFTTPQGTQVSIPGKAFVDQSNQPVTGMVSIQFKDIYKKSDMLLSDQPPMLFYGAPLKSAGEFFICAKQGTHAVRLSGSKPILVQQPLSGFALDTAMRPFVVMQDSTGAIPTGWLCSPGDSLRFSTTNYFFSLYKFSSPADSGTWCNSDNSTYFSVFTQTQLGLFENEDPNIFHTEVFLVFKNINSMVHVYRGPGTNDFPYQYAPIGLPCTVVAVGVKDKKLYSSFVPITISANQTVNFSLSPTTTDEFKTQLAKLN